jgi:uncharacterized YccA/Bax inhibitor family protein
MEASYPGIVVNAALLTFLVMFSLLILYKERIVTVNEKFRSIVILSTMAIFGVYLLTFVLSFIGISIPYIHGNGIIGIGFSFLVVGIASANLLLDFDNIERSSNSGAPKYMEWYCSFSLLVTLIWLYIEMLRLLSKIQSR